MSRRPGIGNNYVTDEIKNYYSRTKNPYVTLEKGIKQPLGRYYKDKIYGCGQLRKEVQNQVSKLARESEETERAQYTDELSYIRAKQEQYVAQQKKANRIIKNNNKL